eukprot:XP_011676662.1 PREDICTED: acid-sensing ion channel 3-like [Strongylocentrotus purpuratus]
MIVSYVALILAGKEHVTKYIARSTKEEFSTIRKSSIAFPAVTICNSNPVKASLIDNPTSKALVQVLVDGSTERGWDTFGLNATDDALETRVDEIYVAHAHQASDMILECAWKRGSKPCGAANFTTKITSDGVCYTFNDGEFEGESGDDDVEGDMRLEVTRSGTRQSLWVRLNAEVDEYVSALSSEGIGFQLLVHRRGDVPLVSDIGVAIMPGVRTLIAIKKHTERNMPNPYDTNCRNASLDYYPFYSEEACLTESATKQLTEACGCRFPHMPGPTPVCTVRQYIECWLPDFELGCDLEFHCQRACYTEHFQMTMSYLKAPGKDDSQRLQNQFNWTGDDVTRNIAEVEIYFADMNEHHTESVAAYSFADLWGDLGGVIGVHMGASLLTFFEVVDEDKAMIIIDRDLGGLIGVHMGASLLTFFEVVDYTFVHKILQIRFLWRKIKRNIAEVEIYFADMNVRHTKSVAANSFSDLWGDLGGLIGVHMGASLLTLFEFVDYTFVHKILQIRFLWRKIKSRCSRDKKEKETTT